jgi:hypothetical protein
LPCWDKRRAELWNLQAGYRFHPDTKERFEDWRDHWLVVAYEGGDPYIFDMRAETILHDYHGRGFWKPETMFRSLAEMVCVFAVLGGIAMQAGDDLTDEQGHILPGYYRDAAESLERILDDRTSSVTILNSLGWEQEPNSPHAP